MVWERDDGDLGTVADGLQFPEGPRWHDGRLWFSDMHAHQVLRLDLGAPEGGPETVLALDDDPSGLGWLPDGRLLVVSMRARALLRVEPSGEVVTVADLSAYATGPCNDMVVDGAGRAYVGNFGFDLDGGEPRGAVVCRVDPDGAVTPVAEDLEFPNGTVLTPDGSTLFVAESYGHRLTAFTVDAEGAVWAASPVTKEVVRVADGGQVLGRVATGERRPLACMLAGPDRRTLVLCTVGRHRETQEGGTGRIEVLDVPVPGAGLP